MARYYIAYGSNLNIRQMRVRCPGAKPIGTSFIEGYQLLFKGSKTGSYLTIEKKPGARVPVAVWAVTEDHEDTLDAYEGFPTFYYKTEMVLPIKRLETGKVWHRRAFVYIMHEERKIGVPSDFYLNTCLEGYRAFRFDETYLYEAYKISKEEKRWKREKWSLLSR